MFNTEHLCGRSVYEIDKVVCIDVYLATQYSYGQDIWLSQLLYSLVNSNYSYGQITFSSKTCTLTPDDFSKEIDEGCKQYAKTREALGLFQ